MKKEQFLLRNTITNHEFIFTPDNIREFRSPAFVILAGQVSLKEGGKVEFEPFAPGLKEPESLAQLADESTRPPGNSVYEALKPYIGKEVTLRFPDKGDWKYGTVAAVLDKCTHNYVVVRRPEIIIQMPDWLASIQNKDAPAEAPSKRRTIPEQATSIPLTFVSVAEDLESKRPMIVVDYSFWDRESY